ncbi:MAG: ribonuclease Y [bacterium]|nr:ribonuclease Y [bacterium]
MEILIGAIALALGAGVGYVVRQQVAGKKTQGAEQQAAKLIEQSKAKEQELILQAKERALKVIEEAKRDEQGRRDKITQLEERLEKRESALEQKLEMIDKERQTMQAQRQQLEQTQEKLQGEQKEKLSKIDEIKMQQLERLEKIASLPKERAEQLVLELTEQKMKDRVAGAIKRSETYMEQEKDRLAKRIIAMAIWRMASEVTTEHSTSTIQLPSEDMKGRIIGREGRNIKHIENLTGVELLVDETPNAIVISGFSSIRRYVAKLAVEKLMADGRIHPGHIEDAVKGAKRDVEKKIKEAGHAALVEVGMQHSHPKLAEVAGRLLFRTSYGQNQLKHAVEVSHLARMMAAELGADVKVCAQAGFLHDIGKAIDHEVQGTHIEIGNQLMQKFGFSEQVIAAAGTHDKDHEMKTPEEWIVAAADAISAARPGARRNTVSEYIKRVSELEKIAAAFEGVETVFAIEAGREVRVIVKPELIDDLKAKKLAHAISDRIEQELTYPGEIRVSVIRETRAIDYAR